jgi:hypothetical protein
MQAYAAYFDASGKKEHPETVVAGIVAPVYKWEAFELDWKIALAHFDVPYFHMREFAASKGAYVDTKWKSNTYRARFMSTLADIVKSVTLMTVARVLKHSLFEQVNKEYELDKRFSPYVICGLDCAMRVKNHMRKLYTDTAPIEYIFDQGDEGSGKLSVEMQCVGLPIPAFRHSKAVKNKPEIIPSIQLQAVDLIAWELRKASATQDLPEFKQYRKSLSSLAEMEQKTWKTYTDLDNMLKNLEVKKRGK